MSMTTELAEALRALLSAQPTYSLLYAEREEAAKALLARYDASSGQAASAVPTGSAAVRLAEQVLSMDMATPKGLRARELARQVLLQADDMLTTLRLIEHATAPTHEDGGHHENAFELSHACIERVTVHMPQPLASPTQPASAPATERDCLLAECLTVQELPFDLRTRIKAAFSTPAAPAQPREASQWDVLIRAHDGSGNTWTRTEVTELAEKLEALAASAVMDGTKMPKERAVEDRSWCRNQATFAALALRALASTPPAPRADEPMEPFLVRDIAAELGRSVPEVCIALREAGLGDFSTNAALTRKAALAVRERLAPRAPSIEPVAEVYHIQHAGLNDDSYATIRLLHRASDQWGLRMRAGTKLYAAPASAGVEEFPLPEHGLPAGVPFEFRSDATHYAEQYARAALRSYSASLGLQARTEGKV